MVEGMYARKDLAKSGGDLESRALLKDSIINGKNWYISLLEAINLWESAEETYKGKKYHYLILGEAFDWLLLAQRLLDTVAGLIPEVEVTAFLVNGMPPIKLNKTDFRRLIGGKKYRAYLNYFYGITVEKALVRAVTAEVEKELGASGRKGLLIVENEAYRRLYGADKATLWKILMPGNNAVRNNFHVQNVFTYRLFQYRLANCEKDRIASDTRKGLLELRRQFPETVRI